MRGFSKGLLVSVLVHGLVGAAVCAIPVDKFSKPETISVDFTLVDQERIPENPQSSGPGLTPRTVARTKTDRIVPGPAKKQKEQERLETEARTVAKEDSGMAPAADPAESEQPFAASPDESREARGASSSSEGAPVAGTAGVPGSASAQGDARGTTVASLGRGGSPGASSDASAGGQAGMLREIRDSVMRNVTYPDKARRMGWEGRVIVSFTVYEDGSIRDARVLRSSGTSLLDDAAKEALKKSTVRMQAAKRVQVVLPIEYKLK